jgi:hypothetical protein
MAKNKPGGGIGSRATNAPTTYFTGQPSLRINPRGVSQIGSALGNHSTDRSKVLTGAVEAVRQGAMGGMGSVELGNQCALDVGKGGPGTGRTVIPAGGKGTHGAVAGSPKPQGRDILSEFGSESPNVRGRR